MTAEGLSGSGDDRELSDIVEQIKQFENRRAEQLYISSRRVHLDSAHALERVLRE